MRRFRLIGLAGLVLAGLLLTLMIGAKPSLQAQQPSAAIASSFVGGAFGGGAVGDNQPQKIVQTPIVSMTIPETKIRLKLHEKVAMNFATETTLNEVLKYVRESTADKTDFPDGLPIYVDPVGLQESDQTTNSTVRIDLKGIPLATSLKLLLTQLNLAYWVHPDGLLIITSSVSEDIPVPSESLIFEKLQEIQNEVRGLQAELRIMRGLPVNGGIDSGPGPATTPAGGTKGTGGMMGMSGGGFR